MSLPNYIKGKDINFTYRKEVRHNKDGTKVIYFIPVSTYVPLPPKQERKRKESEFFIKL